MLEVLHTKRQISDARKALKATGRSAMAEPANPWLRALFLRNRLPIGDMVKSWDVEKTLSFVDQKLNRDASILDLGAYCSEVPVALARMGYTDVHGVDLNSALVTMPMADTVKYQVSDFMHTPYGSASFDAVTAISVIEHGYQPEALFSEISRILRPDGFFIASFDYWPEKIDTGRTRFFDMSWLIFSEQDVQHLLAVAQGCGMVPAGPLHGQSKERAIRCAGFDYTFAWLVLRKT